jgi:hypothetical protein
MIDLNKRRLSTLLFATLFIGSHAQAGETGVKVRFRITERTKGADGKVELRTYENAVLMSFGEKFTGDFQGEFRVSLLALEVENSAKVEITVHDIRRSNALAGQGATSVPFNGEKLLELSKNEERSYSVVLLAEKHALPKQG